MPLSHARVDEVLAGLMANEQGQRQIALIRSDGLVATHRRKREKNAIQELCLTELELASLLRLCHAVGITMTSLLNVLFALVFVDTDRQLSNYETVQFPFFAIHDLLDEYSPSLGLHLTLSPFVSHAKAVTDCPMSLHPEMQIWAWQQGGKITL